MILCIFVLGAVVVVRDCHRYGLVSPTFSRTDFFPSPLLHLRLIFGNKWKKPLIACSNRRIGTHTLMTAYLILYVVEIVQDFHGTILTCVWKISIFCVTLTNEANSSCTSINPDKCMENLLFVTSSHSLLVFHLIFDDSPSTYREDALFKFVIQGISSARCLFKAISYK